MSTLYLRPAYPARQYGFTPAAEIVRDGEDAVVKLELPGVNVADDVTVEVDRGRLVVRGERRDERTEEQSGRRLARGAVRHVPARLPAAGGRDRRVRVRVVRRGRAERAGVRRVRRQRDAQGGDHDRHPGRRGHSPRPPRSTPPEQAGPLGPDHRLAADHRCG